MMRMKMKKLIYNGGVSPEERGGAGGAAPSPLGQSPPGQGCAGQVCSPGLTRMARNTGKRRIHQKPMLLLVDQHLRSGRTETAGQPLDRAAAAARHGVGSPSRASAVAWHPAPCTRDCVEPPGAIAQSPHPSACPTFTAHALGTRRCCCRTWYSLDVFIEELHDDPGNEEQHGRPCREVCRDR